MDTSLRKLCVSGLCITIICSLVACGGNSSRGKSSNSAVVDSIEDYTTVDSADSYCYYNTNPQTQDDYDHSNQQQYEEYDEDDPQTVVHYTITTTTTPSSSSSYDNSKRYDNYEESLYCVNGEVVYEGRSDYYIVETNKGYTILETYGGYLSEGDIIRGELNNYNFHYIIRKRTDREIRVYIEDYMLTRERAIKWMGDHRKLKYSDQEVYDGNDDW